MVVIPTKTLNTFLVTLIQSKSFRLYNPFVCFEFFSLIFLSTQICDPLSLFLFSILSSGSLFFWRKIKGSRKSEFPLYEFDSQGKTGKYHAKLLKRMTRISSKDRVFAIHWNPSLSVRWNISPQSFVLPACLVCLSRDRVAARFYECELPAAKAYEASFLSISILHHTLTPSCIHTFIHPYTHTCMHTHIHSYIHTLIHSCIHTSIHSYIPTNMAIIHISIVLYRLYCTIPKSFLTPFASQHFLSYMLRVPSGPSFIFLLPWISYLKKSCTQTFPYSLNLN